MSPGRVRAVTGRSWACRLIGGLSGGACAAGAAGGACAAGPRAPAGAAERVHRALRAHLDRRAAHLCGGTAERAQALRCATHRCSERIVHPLGGAGWRPGAGGGSRWAAPAGAPCAARGGVCAGRRGGVCAGRRAERRHIVQSGERSSRGVAPAGGHPRDRTRCRGRDRRDPRADERLLTDRARVCGDPRDGAVGGHHRRLGTSQAPVTRPKSYARSHQRRSRIVSPPSSSSSRSPGSKPRAT